MVGPIGIRSPPIGAERYSHLAADWVEESAVRVSESIAADILMGYPALKTEALAEARSGTTDEDRALATPAFPVRLRARSSRAA